MNLTIPLLIICMVLIAWNVAREIFIYRTAKRNRTDAIVRELELCDDIQNLEQKIYRVLGPVIFNGGELYLNVNDEFKIKNFDNVAYYVYTKRGDEELRVKVFSDADMELNKICAEELCDMLNNNL